jgi:hypothetical protein
VASAAVLLAAACGGSSSSSSGSGTSGNNGGGNAAAFTAYIDCMAKNGVTITMPSFGARPSRSPGDFPSGQPRPSGSAGARRGNGFPGGGGMFQKPAGVDDATWTKAQAACASVRPTGRGGNGGNGANAAYRNCLQQHGVTLGGNLNTTDPTVKKAMETCKVLKPTASATPTA